MKRASGQPAQSSWTYTWPLYVLEDAYGYMSTDDVITIIASTQDASERITVTCNRS